MKGLMIAGQQIKFCHRHRTSAKRWWVSNSWFKFFLTMDPKIGQCAKRFNWVDNDKCGLMVCTTLQLEPGVNKLHKSFPFSNFNFKIFWLEKSFNSRASIFNF